MRVIAGIYKGRILRPPKGADLRITLDNVKGALFSILGERVNGSRVLDLFAGSGSLGIEALSRGAKSAVFVDSNPRCIKAIGENVNSLGINELSQVKLLRMDAIRSIGLFSRENDKFDIVIADPPYYGVIAKNCLLALSECGILSPGAFVVVEHYKKDVLPERTQKLARVRFETYGDTVLSFYKTRMAADSNADYRG